LKKACTPGSYSLEQRSSSSRWSGLAPPRALNLFSKNKTLGLPHLQMSLLRSKLSAPHKISSPTHKKLFHKY